MYEFDPHVHTIASGHADQSTITDIARQAGIAGLKAVGIADHAPATPGSARASYFRSLARAPKTRCGIEILCGAELNILDADGHVDLDDRILRSLDYAIISMHPQTYRPSAAGIEANTSAYIRAMRHPQVKIIGHPEDTRYPVDFEALIAEARHRHIVIEINNSSLSPDGFRGDVRENVRTILRICQTIAWPIVLSSDSHTAGHTGDFTYALEMIRACDFPRELILNTSIQRFRAL